MTPLTEHFTLEEMTRSETAQRKGIDNTPTPAIVAALAALCQHVLEPVRAHFGRSVLVTSGYRSIKVNRAIGGAGTSQHCRGEAADFAIAGVPNIAVIRWMERALRYDQLIYEFGASGWVHASWRAGVLRNQELTARRIAGKVVYLPGILE